MKGVTLLENLVTFALGGAFPLALAHLGLSAHASGTIGVVAGMAWGAALSIRIGRRMRMEFSEDRREGRGKTS